MLNLIGPGKLEKHTFDMCRFGTPFKKPTTFATNMGDLASLLSSRCTCCDPHLLLQGKVILKDENGSRSRWLTSFASTYPVSLCREIASVAVRLAPPNARLRRSDPTWRWTAAALEAATKSKLGPVHAPRCPRVENFGWEFAVDSWGVVVPPARRTLGPGCGWLSWNGPGRRRGKRLAAGLPLDEKEGDPSREATSSGRHAAPGVSLGRGGAEGGQCGHARP